MKESPLAYPCARAAVDRFHLPRDEWSMRFRRRKIKLRLLVVAGVRPG